MRIAICDDDKEELSHISGLIAEYQLSREVSIESRLFYNVTDFLCDAGGGGYDLVLLDVLMPEVSGIQAAQELRKLDKNVKLIFISASPEFAVESYSVGAYNYLLKPTDADSLFPLLDRVVSELAVHEEQSFVLKKRAGVVRIFFAGLEYVEVTNKTVAFHLADGVTREVTAALADFEGKLLSRPEFFKPHRSYLVNLKYIQSIDGDCIITKNGHSIPVSRLRRNQARNAYLSFLRQIGTDISIPDETSAAVPEKPERQDGLWRILLVDDIPDERAVWADILRSHGCVVRLAENGADALKLAAAEPFDCVLLDVMIPGEDGFSICEKLCKQTGNTPIIFLSCLTETDKQIEGFASGAADYITKDTSAELFWTKVETRIKLALEDRTQFCYGSLLLDLVRHGALIDGKEILLTPVEFDLLRCLSERPGHIFTPEEISGMIWHGQPWDGGQTVQMHMSRLRRKLENACEHHFIESVWGQGYRFTPDFK